MAAYQQKRCKKYQSGSMQPMLHIPSVRGVFNRVWWKTNRNLTYLTNILTLAGGLCTLFMRLYWRSSSLWLAQEKHTSCEKSRFIKTRHEIKSIYFILWGKYNCLQQVIAFICQLSFWLSRQPEFWSEDIQLSEKCTQILFISRHCFLTCFLQSWFLTTCVLFLGESEWTAV